MIRITKMKTFILHNLIYRIPLYFNVGVTKLQLFFSYISIVL